MHHTSNACTILVCDAQINAETPIRAHRKEMLKRGKGNEGRGGKMTQQNGGEGGRVGCQGENAELGSSCQGFPSSDAPHPTPILFF